MTTDRYCIDTSSLIHAWRRSYPIRNFQPVWDYIDSLIEAGRLYSSMEVLKEIERRDDELHEWTKKRKEIFLDIEGDELQIRMKEILDRYPRLVDTRKNRSGADPFVIAIASLYDPRLVVITEERPTGNIEKPNIPDVCTVEGLNHVSVLGLIVQEDWRLK